MSDTEEDAAYRETMQRYEAILPHLKGTEADTTIVMLGHGNLHWLLFALAPHPGLRVIESQSLPARLKDIHAERILLYIDRSADLSGLDTILDADAAPDTVQPDGIYELSYRRDTNRIHLTPLDASTG